MKDGRRMEEAEKRWSEEDLGFERQYKIKRSGGEGRQGLGGKDFR